MEDSIIKVGYLVSYDYKYMNYSLPTVYEYADQIAIAIDKNRQTWSGGIFEIPDSFFEWIKKFDTQNKIKIYEDSFYCSNLTAMQCETRERNMLAEFMGRDTDWHIQIDSDEYFLDFKKFVKYIKTLNIKTSINIYAELVTIFKIDNSDVFVIDSNESFPLATNTPIYTKARTIEGKDVKKVYTKFKLLHQSWGRSEEEMVFKLKNWGHNTDFDILSYFQLWKVINRYTYKYIQNFHPLLPEIWKKLEYINAEDIPTLIKTVKETQEEKNKDEKKSFFNFFVRQKL